MSQFDDPKFLYELNSAFTKKFVYDYLNQHKIHPDQVRTQSSVELRESLVKVDRFLAAFEERSKTIDLGKSQDAADLRALALPMLKSSLLSVKRAILAELESLSSVQKIESIQDLITQVTDERIRSKLHDEINELRDDSEHLRELSQEVEKDKDKLDLETKISLERLNTENFERRSRVWFSLLERE
ncbi:MAG: hypothetical protein AAF685_14995, partial [Cyanobacteria bacterium P01_C01_bin.89]